MLQNPSPPRPRLPALLMSRRAFLQSAGSAAAAMSGGCALTTSEHEPATAQAPTAEAPAEVARAPSSTADVELMVNGAAHRLKLDPRVTLLDALRDHLNLTGTKKGCDRGQCGACTVLVGGRRIDSCLTLAVMNDGLEITTVEGLGSPEALHPVQAAFVEHDAFQCGYCTPGQVCSAVALLEEARAGVPSAATPDVRNGQVLLTDDEIRERMSGNLCRCGAYPNIVAAVRSVAEGGAGTAGRHRETMPRSETTPRQEQPA